MDARVAGVSQSLFVRKGDDGSTWEFASLGDGGCALVRDGQVVATGDGSDGSVAFLLQAFLAACGARPPAAPAPDGDDGRAADPDATPAPDRTHDEPQLGAARSPNTANPRDTLLVD